MALTSNGILYIADQGNNLIRVVTTASTSQPFYSMFYLFTCIYRTYCLRRSINVGVVSRLAGGGPSNGILTGSTDGLGSSARFSSPAGIVVDSAGNLIVTDASNNLVRMITPAGEEL